MVSDKRREDFEKIALYVQSGVLGLKAVAYMFPQVTEAHQKWMVGTTYPSMVDHSIAVMAGGIAVNEALAAARADKKTRRDMLRVASCGFLSASALAWYHGFGSKQAKKGAAVTWGTGLGVVGAAGLAAGFQKYGDDKKTDTKKSTK